MELQANLLFNQMAGSSLVYWATSLLARTQQQDPLLKQRTFYLAQRADGGLYKPVRTVTIW
jgi:hypothetical protein